MSFRSKITDRASKRDTKAQPLHKPSFITRAVNDWFNRLMGIVNDRSFDQEEQYAANCTSRDFTWNAIGATAWGVLFPILTVVATQVAGTEQAGMFSMAFVAATLLMVLANFGIRTYQISDIDETYSFADYQVSRVITCVAMLIVGYFYIGIRGYDDSMATMCMGLFVFRMIDGFADVYEGRLQQVGKLYLAGVSLALRSVLVLVLFCIVVLVTGSLTAASVAMGVGAVVMMVIVTVPLAYLETPKSVSPSFNNVLRLFQQSWPLFVALFLYALIDNMPKFVMEGSLSYDNQLYFNAMYFPATAVFMLAQLVYKPLLVRMAEAWSNPEQRRKFSLIIAAVVAAIIVITVLVFLFMAWLGIPIMSWLYGVDFEQFRSLCYIMLVTGGVTAGIDFLYQTVTVLRRQRDVTVVYLITLVFALFVPILLVGFAGLPGAVISYLIVMVILFVLLLWVYVRIRVGIVRDEREGKRSAQKEKREQWQREGSVPRDDAPPARKPAHSANRPGAERGTGACHASISPTSRHAQDDVRPRHAQGDVQQAHYVQLSAGDEGSVPRHTRDSQPTRRRQ